MKTVKTSDLAGSALDWAVATAQGWEFKENAWYKVDRGPHGGSLWYIQETVNNWHPSFAWHQAGPIIEREIGNIWKHNKLDPSDPDVWTAAAYRKAPDGTMLYCEDGPTALVAAMRCYVASKLGAEVQIPEELICA